LAFTDLIIVKTRRDRERRRNENRPPTGGTFTIERRSEQSDNIEDIQEIYFSDDTEDYESLLD